MDDLDGDHWPGGSARLDTLYSYIHLCDTRARETTWQWPRYMSVTVRWVTTPLAKEDTLFCRPPSPYITLMNIELVEIKELFSRSIVYDIIKHVCRTIEKRTQFSYNNSTNRFHRWKRAMQSRDFPSLIILPIIPNVLYFIREKLNFLKILGRWQCNVH